MTQKVLKSTYIMDIVTGVVLFMLFEFALTDIHGVLAGEEQLQFILQTVFQVAMIVFVPLSLRLMKFRFVQNRIANDLGGMHMEYRKWAILRMSMLFVPMNMCILLYYLFMVPGFGYIAIVFFLASFFIVPTMKRFQAETGDVER